MSDSSSSLHSADADADAPTTPETPASSEASGRAPAPPRPAAQGRILLIEDNGPLQTTLTDDLQAVGYEVVTASDGIEGLQEFLRARPDLVILDLQVPGMHGTRVLAEIQQRSPGIPVVLMTNKFAPVHSAVPSVTVLRKPFMPEWLVREVQRALAGRSGPRPGIRAIRRL